jgi:hypothetical protein
MEFDPGQQRAEQLTEKLRQHEASATPSSDVLYGIQATGTMANLALLNWDAVQQVVFEGIEGGRARDLVGKTAVTLRVWEGNVSVAVRLVERWHAQVRFAFTLEQLRNLENRLLEARSQAGDLLKYVSSPPPDLPEGELKRIEAIGRAEDKTEYLDADTFLARMRGHARA